MKIFAGTGVTRDVCAHHGRWLGHGQYVTVSRSDQHRQAGLTTILSRWSTPRALATVWRRRRWVICCSWPGTLSRLHYLGPPGVECPGWTAARYVWPGLAPGGNLPALSPGDTWRGPGPVTPVTPTLSSWRRLSWGWFCCRPWPRSRCWARASRRRDEGGLSSTGWRAACPHHVNPLHCTLSLPWHRQQRDEDQYEEERESEAGRFSYLKYPGGRCVKDESDEAGCW